MAEKKGQTGNQKGNNQEGQKAEQQEIQWNIDGIEHQRPLRQGRDAEREIRKGQNRIGQNKTDERMVEREQNAEARPGPQQEQKDELTVRPLVKRK